MHRLQCSLAPKVYDTLSGSTRKGCKLFSIANIISSSQTSKHDSEGPTRTPLQNGFLTMCVLAFTQLNLLLYEQQAFRKELVLPKEKRHICRFHYSK